MLRNLRGFAIVLSLLWVVLCIAAGYYTQAQNIPSSVAMAVLPAFLVESVFYLAAGMSSVRESLKHIQPAKLALWMSATAVLPYLVYSLATSVFSGPAFLAILALAAVCSFWTFIFGRSTAADIAFLLFLAAPILFKIFPLLYTEPYPRLQVFVLGVLMWYRTAIFGVLVLRRWENVQFGFIPKGREWWIGAKHYAYFLPVGFGIGLAVEFIRPRDEPVTWLTFGTAFLYFWIVLWVLAMAEEFFFRGLLQPILIRSFRSEFFGLILTSVLFGLVHLGFRNSFPNWQFMAIATCAGVFYGRAYLQAHSVRAAMVTHALVVTTWRIFFR